MDRAGADAAWEVWSVDTFDRDAPARRDAAGHGLRSGLRELWRRVLTEGLRDSSDKTFTDFHLWCGTRVDLAVQPFDNRAYARLRGWIYGVPGPYEAGGAEDREAWRERERTELLDAVVLTHERLLADGGAGEGFVRGSGPDRIRACVEASVDVPALLAALAAL